jgi:hypothetical protein
MKGKLEPTHLLPIQEKAERQHCAGTILPGNHPSHPDAHSTMTKATCSATFPTQDQYRRRCLSRGSYSDTGSFAQHSVHVTAVNIALTVRCELSRLRNDARCVDAWIRLTSAPAAPRSSRACCSPSRAPPRD